MKKTDEGDGSAMIHGGSCYGEAEDDDARSLGMLARLGDDAGYAYNTARLRHQAAPDHREHAHAAMDYHHYPTTTTTTALGRY